MKTDSALEERTQVIGKTIYSMIEGQAPSLFDGKRWKGKVMEASMQDEAAKTQLFRFIDALPSLKNDRRVVKLLNEYMAQVDDAPLMMKQLVGRISGDGMFLPHVTAKIIRAGVESFARQFIGGGDIKDAKPVLEKLRKEGLAFTLDLLGEEVLSDNDAREYARRYMELLEFMGPLAGAWKESSRIDRDDRGAIPPFDISLKVSSFFSQLDPMSWRWSVDKAVQGLTPIFQKAGDVGASVTVDMESQRVKDLTIEIFKKSVEADTSARFVGLALQAYLKDSRKDAEDVIEWAKADDRRIAIRLVKGAYWDYETVISRQLGWPIPVFQNKERTDATFEELSRLLLDNHAHIRPAFATHNIRSISSAIAYAEALGLPKEAIEFQVIYGMGEPIRRSLAEMGYRVRVYTPVGELIPGMAYLIRRLLENTSNESFLRKSFSEGVSLDALLKEPIPVPDPSEHEVATDGFRNEPTLDFSRSENRSRMEEALAKARDELGRRAPLMIDGEDVWRDETIVSVNPARPEEVIGEVCAATSQDAERAIEAAGKARTEWRSLPVAERADYLRKAADEMRKRRFELIALEVYEVGKTWPEADGDITEAIDFLNYYADEMTRLGEERRMGRYPGEENLYLYEPRGVGVVVAPWNFPIAIPVGMISAALVAGNTVIFKPSGPASVCGRRIVEIFQSVGLPGGALQFVPGPGAEIGEYLVSHPGVDFVVFTGSREVGLRLVQLAGETHSGQRSVKRVIAEMGGKKRSHRG